MGLRIAVEIGQYPMGEPTPRSGVFVGRGATPLHALKSAIGSAEAHYHNLTYHDKEPQYQMRLRATFALSEGLGDIDNEDAYVFTPEDHYNCRLFIHERHKGA